VLCTNLRVRAVELIILVKPIGIFTHMLMNIFFGTKIPMFINTLIVLGIFKTVVMPLIFLVPVLVEKWSKWRHTLKNTTHVEITITIGTAILIKNNKKLCSYIHAIFCINRDYYFNPCGIFESITSFTPFFNQEWNKEN